MFVRAFARTNINFSVLKKIIYPLKAASAGAVRRNPAEAFAKGGNSDKCDLKYFSPDDCLNDIVKIYFCLLSNITIN